MLGGRRKIFLANEGDVLVDVSVDCGFEVRIFLSGVLRGLAGNLKHFDENIHRLPSADDALYASLHRLD